MRARFREQTRQPKFGPVEGGSEEDEQAENTLVMILIKRTDSEKSLKDRAALVSDVETPRTRTDRHRGPTARTQTIPPQPQHRPLQAPPAGTRGSGAAMQDPTPFHDWVHRRSAITAKGSWSEPVPYVETRQGYRPQVAVGKDGTSMPMSARMTET